MTTCRLLRTACCLLLTAWVAAVDVPPTLKPGTEGPFPLAGASKDCVLYVPSDYVAGTPMPLILFMHGSGGWPTTEPFKSITGGKGYLVCGLSYGAQPDAGAKGISGEPAMVTAEIAFFRRVRSAIDHTYGVDPRHVILSGLSMGGAGVNLYGLTKEAAGDYCAYAIFASAALHDATLTVAAGLPVLVLNGSEDPNLAAAKLGMPLLRKAGAMATQVVLPGQPHVPSIASMREPVRDWLDQVAKTLPIDATIPGGHWSAATAPADAPAKGEAKEALAQWLTGIPAIQHSLSDKPVIIIAYRSGGGPAGGTGPTGLSLADIEQRAFSFPHALATPLALAHFDCVTLDITGVDRAQSRLLNREIAPCVVFLTKDHTLGAILKSTRITDSAIAAEMRKLLSTTDAAAWEQQQKQVSPTVTSLRAELKKLSAAQASLAALRAAPADDASQSAKDKAVSTQQKKVEDLLSAYDTLRQQLTDALKTL